MDTTEGLLEEVCADREGVDADILEEVMKLAVELAREGREGHKVGTIFMVGDAEAVLQRSRPMILDPLQGHADEDKHLQDANMRETIKELSQLDGAFVVANDGVVLSAARYLDASSSGLNLPLGLGSRHMAAAAMTKETKAVAVVVSQSAVVRLFDGGELVAEVLPELWMLSRYSSHIDAPVFTRTSDQVTVRSKVEQGTEGGK
jgi:DNA integrity scanning protein DisA with diadenylate cyclase activity